eukprot:INCI19132.34.p1 GENE.INCI19132.34~~INCI19132.34.p1  ORF type:complete len:453 (+),score=61.65 INCI19132.34:125-1483(+)
MTVLDNTTVFILQAVLTVVLPFASKRLGGRLWEYAVKHNLLGPAIKCGVAVLAACVAYFVTRREAVCRDHPEFCQRDDVLVLTSAALSAWSPLQYALAGLHFVDYMTRGALSYCVATVGGLAASTVAHVRGASNVLEYAVWLVTSVLLRWIGVALCMAILVLALVYLRNAGNGFCRLCIHRTKTFVFTHGSYRVVGAGLFMALTVLGWWAGPTEDLAAIDKASVANIRADIVAITTAWECADCEAEMKIASLKARVEELKKKKVSLEAKAPKLRVEAEEIASRGKEVAKQLHDVDAAIVARAKADALLVEAERLEADALLLPQQWSKLELHQDDLQRMLKTVRLEDTCTHLLIRMNNSLHITVPPVLAQAQSLSHRVQTTVSSLHKVRDWNIDHDRFSEAKQLDNVATELVAALGDMVSVMYCKWEEIIAGFRLPFNACGMPCMTDRKLSRL